MAAGDEAEVQIHISALSTMRKARLRQAASVSALSRRSTSAMTAVAPSWRTPDDRPSWANPQEWHCLVACVDVHLVYHRSCHRRPAIADGLDIHDIYGGSIFRSRRSPIGRPAA